MFYLGSTVLLESGRNNVWLHKYGLCIGGIYISVLGRFFTVRHIAYVGAQHGVRVLG